MEEGRPETPKRIPRIGVIGHIGHGNVELHAQIMSNKSEAIVTVSEQPKEVLPYRAIIPPIDYRIYQSGKENRRERRKIQRKLKK